MSIKQAIEGICPPVLLGVKRRVETSSLASRLIRGTFWSLVGTVLSRLLGLAASMFVARMIGRAGMGELGIIQSTVGMFSSLAGLSLGLAATKHIAECRVKDPIGAGETIGFLSLLSWCSGAGMTLVVFGLAPWLARHTLMAPALAPQLQAGSLLLFFGVINGVQTGVLSGFEAFKRIAQINFLSGVANFSLVVGGACLAGLSGVVAGLVIALALNCGLNFFGVRREASASGIAIRFKNFHRQWGLLWGFGVPGTLSGFISGPVGWSTSTELVRQPGGYADMGIYNVTNTWFQAVAFLPDLLAQVLLPILSSFHAAKDNRGTNRALALATWTNVAIVVPVIVVAGLLSRFIMGLYGPDFVRGWPVMVLTMLSAGVLMVQGPITNHLVAASRMWAYFWAHILWGGMFLAGAFLLVPGHGAVGLAAARLIAYVLNGLWIAAVVWTHAVRMRKQTNLG
ncbi:MAG TPA: oligosaccharide flippase family protein [Verrucomicrobiae bacterium]